METLNKLLFQSRSAEPLELSSLSVSIITNWWREVADSPDCIFDLLLGKTAQMVKQKVVWIITNSSKQI